MRGRFSSTLAAIPSFSSSLQRRRSCAGGVISTPLALEALRFCTHVEGALSITLAQPTDYSALLDITVIKGLLTYTSKTKKKDYDLHVK